MPRLVEMHEGGFIPVGTEHVLVKPTASGHYELWCMLDGEDDAFQAVDAVFGLKTLALSAAVAFASSMGIATIYVAHPD